MVSLQLRALPGKEALQKFLAAVAEAFDNRTCTRFAVSTNVDNSHLAVDSPGTAKNLASNESVRQFLACVQQRDWLECTSIVAQVQHAGELKYSSGDGIQANISFSPQVNPPEALTLAVRVADLRKNFHIARKADLVAESLPPEQRDHLRYYETALRDLTTKVNELGTVSANLITQSNETLQQKVADLEKRYEQKATALETAFHEKQKLADAANLERQNALSAREEHLKKEVEQFDLRARTGVRRDLLKQIREWLEKHQEPKTCDKTVAKRKAIHVICISVLGAFGLILLAFLIRVVVQGFGKIAWADAWPLSIATVGFAATLVFYIKFNYQWFAEHARMEFSDRKFNEDILRASWVVELFLESVEHSKAELPPTLLASLTQNLFVDFDWKHNAHHPSDQLLDALSRIKAMKVRGAGAGVEIEGNGK